MRASSTPPSEPTEVTSAPDSLRAPAPLLPPETARKLQPLNLGSRLRRPGQLRGDRRSTKRGSSVEFADYRNYAPGDDLRRVDWNLYARTDRLYLKVYEEEEDRSVHLLVDTSASMSFGTPSKLQVAQRLAASLGYVALHEMDRLQLVEFGGEGIRQSRSLRGTAATNTMLANLGGLRPGGASEVNRSLHEYADRAGDGGLLILLSDLLDPGGVLSGLRALAGRGHEITVLHILTPDELAPDYTGDLELVDVETDDRQGLTLDQAAVEAYERRLHAWLEETRQACSNVGATYCLLSSDAELDSVLFGELRRLKVLV